VRACWTRTQNITREMTKKFGGRLFRLSATKVWLLQAAILCVKFLSEEFLGFGNFAVPLAELLRS
jgi:hypothetical protein